MLNLFDLTQGNYRVFRSISYPKYANSRVIFDVKVKATTDSEWVTDIYVSGVYDGPSDVVTTKNYEISWTANGGRLLEAGHVDLILSSGKSIRQVWTSIITPENSPDDVAAAFKKFPKRGQIVTALVSPFKVTKNGMSYTWEGMVRRQTAKA